MKLSCVLVPLLAGALVAAPTAVRADDPTSVRATYLELRDGGCDVANIGSPIVARALRNVPYAMNGKIFKSAELTYLYEHDGGWYSASDASADVAAADRPCVRKLDAQEKALRKRARIKGPIEQAITRHPGVVIEMSRVVLTDWKKFRQSDKTTDGTRTWRVEFESGGGAALVTVECSMPAAAAKAKQPDWSKLDCHLLAAG
jgi:hypothetical protein